MIPITPLQLREQVRPWPADNLRKAIRAALPDLNLGTEAWMADRLLAGVSDPRSALRAEQVAAIWQPLQRRAQ